MSMSGAAEPARNRKAARQIVEADGCRAIKYAVPSAALVLLVADDAESVDRREYKIAHGHLTSQGGLAASGFKVVQIDVYETSEKVAEQYAKLRSHLAQANKSIEEIWVLHGTSSSIVPKIMCGGFKVGGLDGILARHGSQHGRGVYTSTHVADALRHTDNERPAMVIMARALKGAHQVNRTT
ncbi:hypothetical protein JKP88DRAFT_255387 [Tribonema minus]|uniref:Poly [ADP-ribose] polymerase n=1 Tax=Tribonema minus TaxID=303371 RepID=A0A835Z184_9STRA|nr:hypothetical protein JKP88DRAFT_255387 [Tribonema minus]